MFRSKNLDVTALAEGRVPTSAVHRALARRAARSSKSGKADSELMDNNTHDKNTTCTLPVPINEPQKKKDRNVRKECDGAVKERNERGRSRTRDPADKLAATEKKKKMKSKPRNPSSVSQTKNEISCIRDGDQKRETTSCSEKHRLRSRRRALRNPKIRGEIDKLYELIKQSKQAGDEEPSMRDIEKSLLRALPKRKGSRSKRSKAASKVIKCPPAVSRRKVTVDIGSVCSNSLSSGQHEKQKKPTLSRIVAKYTSQRNETATTIFNFDRVTSSKSVNSIVHKDSVVEQDDTTGTDSFSLWDCLAQIHPDCEKEAPHIDESDIAQEPERLDATDMLTQTNISSKLKNEEESIHSEIAPICKVETVELNRSSSSSSKHPSGLFQKFLKNLRSPKPAIAIEDTTATSFDTRTVGQAPAADSTPAAAVDEERAATYSETAESTKVTMLVSMSSPNEASHIFPDNNTAYEPVNASTTLSPSSSSRKRTSDDAHPYPLQHTKSAELKSIDSTSTSIFGFLDVFGDALYHTMSKLDTYPVPTKPDSTNHDIMTDNSNVTDLTSPAVSPRYEEHYQTREDEHNNESCIRIESGEQRDQPSTSLVEQRLQTPATYDKDTESSSATPTKCNPVVKVDSESPLPSTSNEKMTELFEPGSHGTFSSDDPSRNKDNNENGFRESYVLGYLLGSLAVQNAEGGANNGNVGLGQRLSTVNEDDEGLEVIDDGGCGIQSALAGDAHLNVGSESDNKDSISKPSPVLSFRKKGLFGAGRAKRNETKAQTLAKKARAMRPWGKSNKKELPPTKEEKLEIAVTSCSNGPELLVNRAGLTSDVHRRIPAQALVPGQRSAVVASMFAAAMPLDEVLQMIKSQAPPRLAKGFLAYVLTSFAAQTHTVDRNGIYQGYVRCIAENQALADKSFGPEALSETSSPAHVTVDNDVMHMGLPEMAPYELALAHTSYSYNCFRMNCTPCAHHEPDMSQVPDAEIEAIITTVESSLAQLAELPTKNNFPLMSDISQSSGDSGSWISGDDEHDTTDFDTEGDGTSLSGSDDEENEDDVSSRAFSDVADWMEFLAGSFDSSSGSENSAYDRMPSFDVTEWMLRE
ncbi:hypothetical protein MPSEU_000083800 [Mayamaea pseudoterrestris]|nr:hypothetical protein MPSEU_000083800 [Mayamaea pseudoterrestris]